MKNIQLLLLTIVVFSLVSCGVKEVKQENKDEKKVEAMKKEDSKLKKRIDLYSPTEIKADISHLTDRQKKVVEILIEAGKLADDIFWKQTSAEALALRDSLAEENTPEAQEALAFVKINYGPYDLIDEGRRYIGSGAPKKPASANLYPEDLTKEELDAYLKANPKEADDILGQYTIVRRDGDKLKAIPYREAFPETAKIADKLDEAAEYADNPTLKKYLVERAKALRTDDYYKSDMAWMDIKDNDIDVVIGPIESYEDGLNERKTAYECVVFVRDIEDSKRLQMYKKYIDQFEQNLPYDKKYIRKSVGGGHHILNIVNVCFFGGDCQAGTKTIACNLPNDPKVRNVKGGKNQMYKNMMTAKFDKIVVPIAKEIMDPSLVEFADPDAFMSFVTLHEISHTLGRDYVFGKKKLKVRDALKDRYSAIEECKADIMSIVNHKFLMDQGEFPKDYAKKVIATYIPGLYRSLRFGAGEAHGKANLIQLNFLREQGAITLLEDGKFSVNEEIFFEKCAELAKLVLTIEAEGDYDRAGEIIEKYVEVTSEIQNNIDKLVNIPRDINTTYTVIK